jgi:hypothetical protein
VFTGLFARLVAQALPGLRKKMREPLRLIDATSFRLSGLSEWARFSTNACGAKLHVIYDPDADCSLYAALSGPKVNDITAAKEMPIDPMDRSMATYVFDLGYYDYGWWAKLDSAGCRLVTRLKAITKLTIVADKDVGDGADILRDRSRTASDPARRKPQEPLCASCARGARADRDRQGAAHPLQRPRRARRRNRLAL